MCDKNFFSVNFSNSVGAALNLSRSSVRSQLPALELKVRSLDVLIYVPGPCCFKRNHILDIHFQPGSCILFASLRIFVAPPQFGLFTQGQPLSA